MPSMAIMFDEYRTVWSWQNEPSDIDAPTYRIDRNKLPSQVVTDGPTRRLRRHTVACLTGVHWAREGTTQLRGAALTLCVKILASVPKTSSHCSAVWHRSRVWLWEIVIQTDGPTWRIRILLPCVTHTVYYVSATTVGRRDIKQWAYRVAHKLAPFFVRLNFTKYQPIFKIISLSESGEKL